MKEFNTGRLYQADGQRIQWEYRGNVIRFYDVSRMIHGEFDLIGWPDFFEDPDGDCFPIDPGTMADADIEAIILRRYDDGNYRGILRGSTPWPEHVAEKSSNEAERRINNG